MSEGLGQEAVAKGLTRGELLRRGIAGGAGLALLGGLPGRGLRAAREPRPRRRRPSVHGFVTRPDLRPPVVDVVTPARGTADGYLFLAPSSGPGMRGGLIVGRRAATPSTSIRPRRGR